MAKNVGVSEKQARYAMARMARARLVVECSACDGTGRVDRLRMDFEGEAPFVADVITCALCKGKGRYTNFRGDVS